MDGNRMAVRPEAVLLQPSRTYGRWATAGLVALALGVGAWTGGWVSQQRLNASVQRAASGTPVTVPGATEQVLREISLSRLKQLGLGFYNYAEDHRETAPPMDSADHAKEALLAYVDHNDVLFVSPADGHTYHTNPSVSGKPIPGIAGDPAQVVIFYEDPGPDGMRNALFLDGHAKALAPDEWVQVQRASGLAGSDH